MVLNVSACQRDIAQEDDHGRWPHGEGHMDDVTSAIAAFVTGSSPKKMSAAQIDAAVMHLVDALGCAIAATETPPYGVVRDIAAKTPSLRGSSVIGSKTFCSPEMAAFANTCMVRALDFNDYLQFQ